MMVQKEPFFECTSYIRCSVNNCPLCSGYANLYIDPEDKEKICCATREIRVKIAEKYRNILKFGGLTKTEKSQCKILDF
jgi:hypothetical protein